MNTSMLGEIYLYGNEHSIVSYFTTYLTVDYARNILMVCFRLEYSHTGEHSRFIRILDGALGPNGRLFS